MQKLSTTLMHKDLRYFVNLMFTENENEIRFVKAGKDVLELNGTFHKSKS